MSSNKIRILALLGLMAASAPAPADPSIYVEGGLSRHGGTITGVGEWLGTGEVGVQQELLPDFFAAAYVNHVSGVQDGFKGAGYNSVGVKVRYVWK